MASLAGAVRNATGETLLQAWLACEPLAGARLILLTDGALAAADGDGESLNLGQTALVGLVRSAASEHPRRFGLIDLAGGAQPAAGLGDALASEEPEVALRDGRALAPRLAPIGSGTPLVPPVGEPGWQLGSETPGTLEDLTLIPSAQAREPLGPGEVRIAVHAAGLNFRDVLMALGHYPGQGRPELGGEGAGVVIEIGPDVEGLVAGDRVMGLMTNAFGPVVSTDARLVVKIPRTWSFAQAASVPIVLLTAYYGLFKLAGLERGEALLVHGAAGGVGMAACSWRLTWAPRSSPRPTRTSGTPSAASAFAPSASPPRASCDSRTGSSPAATAAASTWCSTRWPVSSSMRRWTCCRGVAASSRSASGTSATQTRCPRSIRGCATSRSTWWTRRVLTRSTRC